MTHALRSKNVIAFALLASVFSLEAHAAKWPFCRTDSLTQEEPAPPAIYETIEATTVTLQNFVLITPDPTVPDIQIATAPMTVNLQDLQALGRGLLLDLTGVDLPNGLTEVQVSEIRAQVLTSGENQLEFANNTTCQLTTPAYLSFAPVGPVTLLEGQSYFVKVDFSALQEVQINRVVTIERESCCPVQWPKRTPTTPIETRGPENFKGKGHAFGHCRVTDIETNVSQSCSLKDGQFTVSRVVRTIDEF